jgi:hypothetical protein
MESAWLSDLEKNIENNRKVVDKSRSTNEEDEKNLRNGESGNEEEVSITSLESQRSSEVRNRSERRKRGKTGRSFISHPKRIGMTEVIR